MIYIHIPFCKSFCTYCDFYSEVASTCRKGSVEDFVQAMEAEIVDAAQDPLAREAMLGAPRTLYIGGGTPSVLPLSAFRRILTTLRAHDFVPAGTTSGADIIGTGKWEEFTVEVNPEDIVEKGPDFVEGLLELGVTRVSMGVQSFDDRILKWMNRRHNAERAVKAYAILEEAGMENISIDLIFGMPQLTMKGWQETLDKALDISSKGRLPAHISSYQLSIEPGSALARLMAAGRFSEAGDELCSAQYRQLCETLSAAGYHHYEISNFAQPGHEAVHNSAYWAKVPYLGLGPGAHSYLVGKPDAGAVELAALGVGGGVGGSSLLGSDAAVDSRIRRWNNPDLRAYIAAGASGDFSAVRGHETLTAEEHREECIMLGLRTAAGVEENYLRGLDATGHILIPGQSATVDRLLAEGALTIASDSATSAPGSFSAPGSSVAAPGLDASSASGSSVATSGLDASSSSGSSVATSGLDASSASGSSVAAPGHRYLRIPESRFFVSDDIISELI